MVVSHMGPAPAEPPQDKATVSNNCGPMSQQGSMGGYGHEMHPQEFLRLVGCHEAGRKKPDDELNMH